MIKGAAILRFGFSLIRRQEDEILNKAWHPMTAVLFSVSHISEWWCHCCDVWVVIFGHLA